LSDCDARFKVFSDKEKSLTKNADKRETFAHSVSVHSFLKKLPILKSIKTAASPSDSDDCGGLP
jgi:hypothetical protein